MTLTPLLLLLAMMLIMMMLTSIPTTQANKGMCFWHTSCALSVFYTYTVYNCKFNLIPACAVHTDAVSGEAAMSIT